MLNAIVTAADVQDRDGGAWLLGTLFGLYLFLLKLYADGGYQGPEFRRSVKAVLSKVSVELADCGPHHDPSFSRTSAQEGWDPSL